MGRLAAQNWQAAVNQMTTEAKAPRTTPNPHSEVIVPTFGTLFAIGAALIVRLKALVLNPVVPIAEPDVAFTQPDEGWYPTFMPNRREVVGISDCAPRTKIPR